MSYHVKLLLMLAVVLAAPAFASPPANVSRLRLKCQEALTPILHHEISVDGPIDSHPMFPYLGEHHLATLFYLNVKGLKIPIVFPSVKEGFPADVIGIVFHLITSMPYKYIEALKELRINPENFQLPDVDGGEIRILGMASSEMKSLDLTPLWIYMLKHDPIQAINTFGHEFGHLLAYHWFGGPQPPKEYEDAARKDGNQISEYGSSSMIEDWAEAMGLYFRDTKDDKFRALYPNRFHYIDTWIAK